MIDHAWIRRILLVLFLTAPTAAASAQIHNAGPVTIDSGRVSGAVIGSRQDISVYKGIPYAAPPIGDLRWRAPQPAQPWSGVRAAASFGPIAPQRPSPQPQDEDCLYLNVWTPARTTGDRLPVMVWIHGGGFTYGSSSSPLYDGTRIAEQGVVLVSFNYRLNVLSGFAHPLLSQESGRGSGNYGILDSIAALNWVKRNVAAFGGDPGNVTIFGESAGGLAVSALATSPLTTGLFHKAIVQSGSGAQITTLDDAERAGQALVEKMGVAGDASLLRTLRARSWKDFPGADAYRGAPTLDGFALTGHPSDFWAKAQQHNVPMIIGYNRDEATFFTGRDGDFPQTIDALQRGARQRFGAAADRVLALYPVKTDQDAYWAEVAIRTDSRFGVSARRQLRGMFSVPARTWAYYFTYLPDASRDSPRGVSHASELAFVFGTLPAAADHKSRQMSDAIIRYWTQFAKTGNPNQPGLPEWPEFARDSEAHLELGQPIRAARDLNKAKIDLFESLQQTAQPSTSAPQPLRLFDAACTAGTEQVTEPKTGRTYLLDYPCDLRAGEKVTFVLNLHGGGSSGTWQRRYFPVFEQKERHRLIVASPYSPTRRWSETDDAYLQNIVTAIVEAVGRDNIQAFWLAGHSQGGSTSRRIVCSDFFRSRVDGFLSLSGGRLGGAAPRAPNAGRPRQANETAPAAAAAAPPQAAQPAEPTCDFSHVFAIGEHEITSLPAVSAWAQKYGCGARLKQPDVVDEQPGYVHDGGHQNPASKEWGRLPRPGRAEVFVYPGCRDGRVVADVVRIDKGHTEGLEPAVTEALVKLMVSARGGKIQQAR